MDEALADGRGTAGIGPSARKSAEKETAGEKRVDLVCEGGGVRGIAIVGALAVLEEQGYQVQNMAGTSAGAIVTALAAAGYTAAELRAIIGGEDFAALLDPHWLGCIPLAGQPLSLVARLGLYRGDALYRRLRQLLAAKGVVTFKDLRSPANGNADGPDDPRYAYKVQVIASDLSARRLLILPYAAAAIGYDPDELEVALAVRMSWSIPFFFEPVRLREPKPPHAEHVIVDGGLLSNYPIWFFDQQGTPRWPTFGLRLVEGDVAPRFKLTTSGTGLCESLASPDHEWPGQRTGDESRMRGGNAYGAAAAEAASAGMQGSTGHVDDLISFAAALVNTMLEAHDRLAIESDASVRTIAISTPGIGATDFQLTRQQTDALYISGRQAAERFLATWDFASYIATCRSGGQRARGVA